MTSKEFPHQWDGVFDPETMLPREDALFHDSWANVVESQDFGGPDSFHCPSSNSSIEPPSNVHHWANTEPSSAESHPDDPIIDWIDWDPSFNPVELNSRNFEISTPTNGSKKRQARMVKSVAGYACTNDKCHRTFDRAGDRRKHEQTHLPEASRPYRCPKCDKGFWYPKDLERHRKVYAAQSRQPEVKGRQRGEHVKDTGSDVIEEMVAATG